MLIVNVTNKRCTKISAGYDQSTVFSRFYSCAKMTNFSSKFTRECSHCGREREYPVLDDLVEFSRQTGCVVTACL